MTRNPPIVLPGLLLIAACLGLFLPDRHTPETQPGSPDPPVKTGPSSSPSDLSDATAPSDRGKSSGKGVFPSEACTIGGCSIGHHTIPALKRKQYNRLLQSFREQPVSPESNAFEKLLYYGKQTRAFINSYGTDPLGERRSRALKRELTRTHALVSIRVTDEDGTIRLRTQRKKVPLGKSKHFPIKQTTNLKPPELSGTVYRTGVKHLWARY